MVKIFYIFHRDNNIFVSDSLFSFYLFIYIFLYFFGELTFKTRTDFKELIWKLVLFPASSYSIDLCGFNERSPTNLYQSVHLNKIIRFFAVSCLSMRSCWLNFSLNGVFFFFLCRTLKLLFRSTCWWMDRHGRRLQMLTVIQALNLFTMSPVNTPPVEWVKNTP